MLSLDDKATIRAHFKTPLHIVNCARAIRYDLLEGPTWSRIPGGNIESFTSPDYFSQIRNDLEEDCEEGDKLEETYTGVVASTLRDYISELPSESYMDTFAGGYLESEPQGYYEEPESPEVDPEEDVEDPQRWVEPAWEYYVKLSHRDVVEALFGKVIADEFR